MRLSSHDEPTRADQVNTDLFHEALMRAVNTSRHSGTTTLGEILVQLDTLHITSAFHAQLDAGNAELQRLVDDTKKLQQTFGENASIVKAAIKDFLSITKEFTR